MINIDVYNTSGKKTSTLSLNKEIFAAKINQNLMAQAVRVYLSNQRQAAAKTKSRGEIVTSKSKVWRQKGTGRARHGSRNAPIFVGGAKAHGPTGEQNYKLKMGKKMRRLSLFSALTQKLEEKSILVINGLNKLDSKTKLFDQALKATVKSPKKVLLILTSEDASIRRGSKNLAYATPTLGKNINTYNVLNASTIIFTKESLKALEDHFLPKKDKKDTK